MVFLTVATHIGIGASSRRGGFFASDVLPRSFWRTGVIFRSAWNTTGGRVFPWYGTFRERKPPNVL